MAFGQAVSPGSTLHELLGWKGLIATAVAAEARPRRTNCLADMRNPVYKTSRWGNIEEVDKK